MHEDIRRQRFEVGDVLLVSCPWARARVVGVTSSDVSVEWPWARIDPDSAIRWNGHRAIPRTRDHEWGGLFQIAPHAGNLRVGDSCWVGVPETLVRIIDIGRFDPPADVGWLPRPHTMLIVLPADRPRRPDAEEEGDTIDLDSAAPLRIEPVSRG
ncbi:hypothetical protein [Streptomyces glaucus]|uniref:Uncharacterized protein n=1 Tax=Streptomyces glaucus TaxID=284029 RepID=A0ABP5X556_9ACTN